MRARIIDSNTLFSCKYDAYTTKYFGNPSIKNKLFIASLSLIISMVLLIPQPFAEQPCKRQQIETIYLYKVVTQPTKEDFNAPLQEFLKAIETISSKLELKEFQVTATDISASKTSDSEDIYDYSISVSVTFLKDTRAFTQFMKKLTPSGGSSSVSTTEKCL